MRCRILNIGPASGIHGSLSARLEADGLISVQHIDTGILATAILNTLADSELPHVVIIPYRFQSVTATDFITELRSQERFQSMHIFVWGSGIPAHAIEGLYDAGADCVLPGQFNTTHLDTMREFCRECAANDATKDQPRYAITPDLLHYGEKSVRNARLGNLFLWAGGIPAILWICLLPQIGLTKRQAHVAPFSVYAALACAGCSLLWERPRERK